MARKKRRRRHYFLDDADFVAEATNPETSPERLRWLASWGRRVQRAVASNPNTPEYILLWLAGNYTQEVLNNPVLPLLMLENPGLPAEFPVLALRKILQMAEPPREFFGPLVRHPNLEIREAARLHRANRGNRSSQSGEPAPVTLPDVPIHGGAALAELVAMDLAPRWIVQSALESASGTLRRHALPAVQRLGDAALQERVAWLQEAGADAHLQYITKANQAMLPERLAVLARGGPFARQLAAKHPNTPPAILSELAELHQDKIARRYAATNPSTPSATLISLAATGNTVLRKAVAKNKSCSSALLDQLAGDASMEVRCSVAAHRGSAAGTLARLASDPYHDVREILARNSRSDEATLRVLAQDAHDGVRETIAKRRDCPKDLLFKLMADKEFLVAVRAAENPTAPGDSEIYRQRVLDKAFRDWEDTNASLKPMDAPPTPEELEKARMLHVVRAKPVPMEILREALAHPSAKIRRIASYDKQLTPEMLASRLHDEDRQVRSSIARNPLLPRELRLQLCADESASVRAEAIEAGDMPDEVFDVMSRDENQWLRLRVAGSRFTPNEVRLRMAREETEKSVLQHMFSALYEISFDQRVSDVVILTVLERMPDLADRISNYDHLTPAIVEVLLPHLNSSQRRGLFWHQSFAHGYRKRTLTPWPTETILKICELPEEEYHWQRRLHLTALRYWAITPEAIVEIARLQQQEAKRRASWQRRQSWADGVLGIVASHPRTPPSLLSKLTRHSSPQVRLAALDNPHTPTRSKTARRKALLPQAASSQSATVRLCALSSLEADVKLLRKAIKQGRWMERLAVARNTGAPREILEELRDDSNVAVAAAARETLAALDAPDEVEEPLT